MNHNVKLNLVEARQIKNWIFSHKDPEGASYYLPDYFRALIAPDADLDKMCVTPAIHYNPVYNCKDYFDGVCVVVNDEDDDGYIYTADNFFLWFHDIDIMEQENNQALYYESLEIK